MSATIPSIKGPSVDTVLNELREIQKSLVEVQAQITSVKKDLQDEIHGVKSDVVAFQQNAAQLQEVVSWSRKLRDTITIDDIKALREEVQENTKFKTRAMTVFLVAQALMGAAISMMAK